MAEKPWSWFFVCLLWTGPVFGMSVMPDVECPTQFRAIASEIKEPTGAITGYSKLKVVFNVEEKLKGVVDDIMEVEFLKFGPMLIERGKEYVVELNQGKVCGLESVE